MWMVSCYLLLVVCANIDQVQPYRWSAVRDSARHLVNSNATLAWSADLSDVVGIASVFCSHAPLKVPYLVMVLAVGSPVTSEGLARYPGNRLQVKQSETEFNITIKNVMYNDSITFACQASFLVGTEPLTYTTEPAVNITLNVVGPPEYCGQAPSGNLTFNVTQSSATYSTVLCGKPRPSVAWELNGDKRVGDTGVATGIAEQYRYTFAFGALTPSVCGKALTYVAGNEVGTLTGRRSVNVLFTPEKVSGVNGSVQQNFTHDCINMLLWAPVPRGDCRLSYEVRFSRPGSTAEYQLHDMVTSRSVICSASNSSAAVPYSVQVRAQLSVGYVGDWSDATKLDFIPYKGGPFLCGERLPPVLALSPVASSITMHVCGGGPAPTVRWYFAGTNHVSSPVQTLTLHLYAFNYSFPPLRGALCGENLTFEASGFGDSVRGGAVVLFPFKPDAVQDLQAYAHYISNQTCIRLLSWKAAPSGNCDMMYQVHVYNASDLVGVFNFSKADVGDGLVQLRDSDQLCFHKTITSTLASVQVRAVSRTLSEVTGNWTFAEVRFEAPPTVPLPVKGSSSSDAGLIGGVVAGSVAFLIIIAIIIFVVMNKKGKVLHTSLSGRKSESSGNDIPMKKPPESDYDEVRVISTAPRPVPALLYAELGPGGREGPRPLPRSPDHYASVKTDEHGYPAVGGDLVAPQYAAVSKDGSRLFIDSKSASAASTRPRTSHPRESTSQSRESTSQSRESTSQSRGSVSHPRGSMSNKGYAGSGDFSQADEVFTGYTAVSV